MYGARSLFRSDPARLDRQIPTSEVPRSGLGQIYLTTNDPKEHLLCACGWSWQRQSLHMISQNTERGRSRHSTRLKTFIPLTTSTQKLLLVRIRSVPKPHNTASQTEQATYHVQFQSYNQVVVTPITPLRLQLCRTPRSVLPEAGAVTSRRDRSTICTAQSFRLISSNAPEAEEAHHAQPDHGPLLRNKLVHDGLGSWYASSFGGRIHQLRNNVPSVRE